MPKFISSPESSAIWDYWVVIFQDPFPVQIHLLLWRVDEIYEIRNASKNDTEEAKHEPQERGKDFVL